MPQPRVVVLAAAVMVGGAAAGFTGYHAWQRGLPPATTLSASLDAARDDTSQTPPVHSPVPDQVPAITLPDPDGHPHALRDFLGLPLIINFWATWCEPCRREVPLLQQLRTGHAGELAIVGIALDFQAAVKDYIASTSLNYPVLIGEDNGMIAAEKFGMEPVLPFSVFSDAQGRIIAVKVGELHRDEAEFILQRMQALERGHGTLADTRRQISDRLQEFAIMRAKSGVTHPPPQ